jgi:transcriptional regulator
MYQPTHHREDRLEVQHQLIEDHPLGLLISAGSAGLVANAIPFLLQRSSGPRGTLQTHMARANGQWQELDGREVLVVFQGPQAYVSPSFYATKRETGMVVPTWNYAMVQARGVARLRTDPAWLEAQISALTSRHEASRTPAWAVSDAPRTYIEGLLRAIVGIEIEIDAIEGKWKVSQNRPQADRRGVADGLAQGNPEMSELVRRYADRSGA